MTERRKKKAQARPELSRLELDVMDVVWELGDCSSAEVITRFNQQKRSLAETTIRTVLANLRKKGYLKPIPTVERGFRLRATVSRDQVAGRSLKEIVQSLFGGSPAQAISYLLKDRDISDDEFEEIRRMVEGRTSGRNDQ